MALRHFLYTTDIATINSGRNIGLVYSNPIWYSFWMHWDVMILPPFVGVTHDGTHAEESVVDAYVRLAVRHECGVALNIKNEAALHAITRIPQKCPILVLSVFGLDLLEVDVSRFESFTTHISAANFSHCKLSKSLFRWLVCDAQIDVLGLNRCDVDNSWFCDLPASRVSVLGLPLEMKCDGRVVDWLISQDEMKVLICGQLDVDAFVAIAAKSSLKCVMCYVDVTDSRVVSALEEAPSLESLILWAPIAFEQEYIGRVRIANIHDAMKCLGIIVDGRDGCVTLDD